MRALTSVLLLVSFVLLGGCASYDAQLMPGQNLDGAKRFFVLTNPNDTHGVGHQIVAALRARGREAETGPLTMMPDATQVMVTYEDHWSWDFGDHLVYAQVSARARDSNAPLSTARFSTRLPTRKSATDIVSAMVGRMLAGEKP
jgi:hypothetical protein